MKRVTSTGITLQALIWIGVLTGSLYVAPAAAQEPVPPAAAPAVEEIPPASPAPETAPAPAAAPATAALPESAVASETSTATVSNDVALPPPYVPANPPPPPAPPVLPYAQHDMELGIGLGFGGYADSFTLAIGADFAYYVVQRLAPGLDISYQVTWGDVEYPQSFTLFPYLKFVLIRSFKFAPYILVGGGRDWEWSGADTSWDGVPYYSEFNGYVAVDSWLFGVGGGAVVMFGGRVGMKMQLLAVYENFDEEVWDSDENENVEYWWYPDLTLGIVFAF